MPLTTPAPYHHNQPLSNISNPFHNNSSDPRKQPLPPTPLTPIESVASEQNQASLIRQIDTSGRNKNEESIVTSMNISQPHNHLMESRG